MSTPGTPPTVDVIVIGAGPVGLFLAHLLGQAGRSTLLLEKRPTQTAVPSMAIGIMPPSLRRFDAAGLAAPLVAAGRKVRTAVVHDHSAPLGRLDFATLPAPFSFILALPQGELMGLLRDRLTRHAAVRLRDGHEAIAVQPAAASVAVQARDVRDGSRHAWSAAYVVACDGHESTVRQHLGIAFPGASYPESFLMGDFPDTTSWTGEAHLFFTPWGSVESFPLPHGQRRWVALADPRMPTTDTATLVRRVQTITDIRLDGDGEQWHSAFTPQRRRAASFFRGRVALCGDAAHVMSPIGGQGMNTGFADAWHLAAVLQRLLRTGEPPGPRFARYQADRARAFRIAANRAARGMWLGTRTGRLLSAARSAIIRRALLRPPLSRRLPAYFAMLTIPEGRTARPAAAPGGLAS